MGGPYQRLTIGIDGLACGGALSVERAIARLPGVIRVYVNPLTEMEPVRACVCSGMPLTLAVSAPPFCARA